jgi:hypothetical protein
MAAIGTRSLTLTVDGTDVTAQVSTCVIKAAETDSDFVSFADAAAGGGREYTLALTFVQDPTAGTLWDQVWAHAGEEVPALVRPYGNAVASADQPHWSCTAIISEPDGDLLGGEADASPSNRFVTEVEWKLAAKPTKVVA